jgi:spore maturation protein CgeB
MRIVWFAHSLVSDWNHGNAHFLRGVVAELQARRHDVEVWEPAHGWSRSMLLADRGERALGEFREAFPDLRARLYDVSSIQVDAVVEDADVVIAHEWSDPWLVAALGHARHRGGGFRLLFHDTHHRAATAPDQMARYDLSHFDGVLAYGSVIRDIYIERGWCADAWTWHEAADTRLFHPRPGASAAELVWIGNWGDGERTRELGDFLFEPARALRLSGSIFGVRYPATAVRAAERAGLRYRGWLPNHRAPAVYADHRVTVHVPRGPYVSLLPGIPTIRPFEALACGIPLVSAPWEDSERLFRAGEDYLVARDGREMRRQLREVLEDRTLARSLAAHGRRTILERHTCAHRVDELLAITARLGLTEAAA